MSSHHSPQQYNVDPGPPQYQPQPGQPQYQQPAMQPPAQPYVEQGPPQPYQGGGQPPYQPPGGYTPMPAPQEPPRRRRGPIILASVLAVALAAGIGAFVLFNFVFTTGPDPAERFPASASMYMEVNLDPSFDQTPKLLDHLNKFEGLDFEDTDDMLADLLDQAGLEGVDADEDLNSWLGRRHGVAMWEHDGAPYGVINLASTDADAAEAGLDSLRDASGATEDQWAYTVTDDAVLMVVGDQGAPDALAAAESEADSSPLSGASGYEEARSWLDGDQLFVYWLDVDSLGDMVGSMGGEAPFEAVESVFSGHFITGVAAFDDGFEVAYRLFGDQDDPWTGSEDLLANMGDMPAGDFALTADVPDNLDELVADMMEDFDGGTDTGAPLTDAEYEEYLALDEQWWNDTLAPEDEERYSELETRYWEYGTEAAPYDYGDDYGTGSDVEAALSSMEEFIDLLAGSQLSIAGDLPDNDRAEFDPETLFLRALLADDSAADLDALITELLAGEPMPDGVEVDGSSLTFQGANTADGALSDDDRFSGFADAAPDSAALAVWADLSGLADYEEFKGAEPLSAFAWAHGSQDGDGTGLMRLYLQ